MNYRVVIHDVAKEDIRRNANWWAATHSASQAESWFHNAFDSIESLAFMPESHPLAPEYDEFTVEMRELHFGLGSRPGYRAIFCISGDVVHVLTIRRAAQDRISPADIDLNL